MRASSAGNGGDLVPAPPLFADRFAAGRLLARSLADERDARAVVVGLARGGVQVAYEVASALEAPLDVVAVRKVGHPWQPEYAIGAVTPGDGVYVRGPDGLSGAQVAAAVARAQASARELDARLHAGWPALRLAGASVLVVDDGLATGATMIASLRWARAAGAARVVAAAPVGPTRTLETLRDEADEVVCPYALDDFFAVGVWYASFRQVGDEEVVRLLAESRQRHPRALLRRAAPAGGAR